MENTDGNSVLRQNSKLLTTLLEVSNLVSSTMELKPLLEAILEKLGTIIEYKNARIFVVDGGKAGIIARRPDPGAGQEIAFSPVLGIRCVNDRKPVVIKDLHSDEDTAVLFRKRAGACMDTVYKGVRCLVNLPMVYKNEVVGVLELDHSEPGFYNEYHVELGMAFASQAAIEYKNIRLYEETIRLYEEEKRRLKENEQRRRVAEGLGDILKALNSNKSLEDILDFIIKHTARLLHAESAVLFRFGNDKRTLVPEASFGMPGRKNGAAFDGAEAGIMVEAFMERRPLVMTDLSEKSASRATGSGEDSRLDWLRENYHGIMAVPLVCKDEVYGGIALYFKKGGKHQNNPISGEEISLAMTFADQAALAIDNTRLRKKAEEMAVAAERNRLARDLHDSVTQTLFSASLIAEVVPKMWELNRDEGMKRLEELRQLTRGALAEMRMLLFELRPATLMEAPINELLKQLAQAITGRARITVELDIKGTAKLPLEVKTVFYRVAQEALNNVAKHSGAKKAAVELRVNEDEQLGVIVAGLRVSDDGRGFEPEKVVSGHFGLGIMKERAESVGAKLKVASRPGEGTVVSLEWVGGK
ncbi:MAG: GAF domain-containing protein [Bacillota bacterium]